MGRFPHFTNLFLVAKHFFSQTQNLHLVMSAFYVWSEQVWSGRGENQLDKPSVERNHKKRSREVGYSFLHIQKSIERGRHSLRDYVAEKGMLPYVGCVGVGKTKPHLM